VCISRGSSPVKTLADLMQKELIVGDTGAGTGTYVFPRALNGLFGTKFKIVSGFQNSVDVFLALERGEVDGICESLDSVSGKSPGWREKGVFNAVLHGGLEPDPHLKGVPFVFELAKTEEDRQVLRFLYAGQAIGRPFAMPPDVPAARVEIMRKAFAATMKDEAFLAEAGKLKLDVDPVPGEKLADIIRNLAATPRSVIDRVAKFMH
jgi:tripartite-type tricarboxylate transporter receptor subunit TctC